MVATDFNQKAMRRLLLLAAFSICLFLGLQNLPAVLGVAQVVLGLVAPFLLGLCIAFILNVILRLIENRLFAPLNKRGGRLWGKVRRPLGILLTLGAVAGVLMVLTFLIVPEVRRTLGILKDSLPGYFSRLQGWTAQLLAALEISPETLYNLKVDWEAVWDTVNRFLRSSNILNTTANITASIFSGIFNFVLGLVFSIYVLLQKEKLSCQVKLALYAFLPQRAARKTCEVGALSNRIFSNFVTGQLTEAVIIGLLCFAGMLLFGMPYAPMIAALVGFTALIPVFGAFIGTGVGAFLILMVNPMKALWFVVFIIVLQQLEGNLIYPRVVGSSVGLPGIWVLTAVTIGGAALGVMGMLLSVPMSSVLYCLLREAVASRLAGKGLTRQMITGQPPDGAAPTGPRSPKGGPQG